MVLHHKTTRTPGGGGIGAITLRAPLFVTHWGDALSASELRVGSVNSCSADKVKCDDSYPSGSASDAVADVEDEMGLRHVGGASAESRLLEWGCRIPASNLPVLLVPAPIYELVLARWQERLHFDRFYRSTLAGPVPDWPPADCPAWANRGQDLSLETSERTLFRAHSLARDYL